MVFELTILRRLFKMSVWVFSLSVGWSGNLAAIAVWLIAVFVGAFLWKLHRFKVDSK